MLDDEAHSDMDITEAASLLLGARAEPRVAVDQPVDVYAADFAGPLPARLRDISVSGACLATRTPIAAGSVRRVVLRLPRGRLDLGASGRWQRGSRAEESVLTGISFGDASPAHSRVLSDFVFSAAREQAEFVRDCSDFSDLGTDDLFNMVQASRYRVIPEGQCVYRQGESDARDRSIFLVKEGGISLVYRVRDARDVVLMRLGPGSLFGGLPLIAESANTESAIAQARSILLEVTAASFDYIRVARPLIGYRVARVVARTYAERVQALLERVGAAL